MFLRFTRSFLRIHGISKGALERCLSTNLRKIKPFVSTSLPNDFHAFSIPVSIQDADSKDQNLETASHITSPPLIQKSSLRRIKSVFTSVIYNILDLISRYSINRVLLLVRPCTITAGLTRKRGYLSHQTQKPFCITPSRQENPASQENYA